MARFCPLCGAKREDGAKNCTGCRHPFEIEAAAEDTSVSAPEAEQETEAAAPDASEPSETIGAGPSGPSWDRSRSGFKFKANKLTVSRRVLLAGAAVAVVAAVGLGLWTNGVLKGVLKGGIGAGAAAEATVLDFDLMPIAFGEKCGFVDTDGKLVINPQYDSVSLFVAETGLAPVETGGKWGLIDRQGTYVVNPQYDGIYPAGNRAVFRVKVGDRWGTIDKVGDFVINPQFDYIADFDAQGRALVSSGGKLGLIDETGRYLVPPQFEDINYAFDATGLPEYFAGGLAAAKLDGKWGYINESGTWVINPQFASAWTFDEGTGLANVMITQVNEVVDTAAAANWDAEVAAYRSQYKAWGYVYQEPERPDFKTRTETNVWGYIDKTGKLVITPQFVSANGFGPSGLAPVLVGETWGYIGASGTFRINPQFAWAGPFTRVGDQWLAVVAFPATPAADAAAELRFGVIDSTGAVKINPQFSSLQIFDDQSLAIATLGENTGAIDITGKFVINPAYSSIARIPGSRDYLSLKRIAGTDSLMEIGRLDRTGKVLTTFRGAICGGALADEGD
jgi:hypothetical protein